jgi:hypothetical protein
LIASTRSPAAAPATNATRFVFSGALEPESFRAFAEHRAARLDLGLHVGPLSTALAELAVSGPEPLVDAFEMACSLGPTNCLILDVTRSSAR